MTISQRQFTLLNEMGISLWQRRVLPKKVSTKIYPVEKQTAVLKAKTVDLNELNKQQIFNDILLSLNLLPSDISVNNNQLVLKKLTWQFTNTDNINFTKNTLTTPSLPVITHSPLLKNQLWQVIQKQATQEEYS